MRWPLPSAFRSTLSRIVSDSDDDDLRLQKVILLIFCCTFGSAGLLWGAMYLAFGRPLSGIIPLLYGLFTLASVAVALVTRRYRFLRTSQLVLGLALPFALQLSLGGYAQSSAVILWSWSSVMGALLLLGPAAARKWFAAFVLFVVSAGIVEAFLPRVPPLGTHLTTAFFVLNIVGLSGITFLLLRHFVREKDTFLALLRIEEGKSQRLLLNVLPPRIAAILRENDDTIAELSDSVSVMFADVVNFTPLAARLTPSELVELLNDVFSTFDGLVEQFGLEKIKTIGDCYMVAAGLPEPRPDHAEVLVDIALAMLDYMRTHMFADGLQLDVRIGINSGPVVAGVIGRRKFAYDLWGDTVNVASRMESSAEIGVIQIAEPTYRLISDTFVCVPRGVIDVKGKGPLAVWTVSARRTSDSRAARTSTS
jgi:adenylate cyclase